MHLGGDQSFKPILLSSESLPRRRDYPELPLVGAGALIHDRGKILLVKRTNEPNRGRWALPGGLVELGESVEDAVKREVKEEVGLDVEVERLIDIADDIHQDERGRVRYHYILLDYLARPMSGKVTLNAESSSSRWFDPEEVQSLNASENTKNLVRRFIEMNSALQHSH